MGENEDEDGGREANTNGVGGGDRQRERFLLQTGLRDLITVKH